MKPVKEILIKRLTIAALCAAVGILSMVWAGPLHAQENASDQDTGYRTTEEATPVPPANPAADNGQLTNQGPVRMARFGFLNGNVSWKAAGSTDWTPASINQPIREGSEVLVLQGGRAELQFDDGSEARLGSMAHITLKTLFSDANGEFTQINLEDGLMTLRSRYASSVYEVDTPLLQAKTGGAAQVRFGVDGGTEVAVQRGTVAIDGPKGHLNINEGNYLYADAASNAYETRNLPDGDAWDKWNAERNKTIDGTSETAKHVPSNIGLVSEELDSYGVWHEDAKYGWVWAPRIARPGWRPYFYGHWVWVDPFGWTWVSDEPWGWAPYHYGTWVELSWGWSWCPGPRWQYWSPGVVSFCSYGGNIGWAPLCPWEVRYPAFCSVGCWGSDWCLSFSIGWAGCYYPFGRDYCAGRRFDNHWVNTWHGYGGVHAFNGGFAAEHGHGFIPYNARNAAGATVASNATFGGRGQYQPLEKGNISGFGNGRTLGGAPDRAPVAFGPASAQASAISRTASRTIAPSPTAPGISRIGAATGSFTRSPASGNSSAAEAARAARAAVSGLPGGGYVPRSSGTGSGYSGAGGGFSRGSEGTSGGGFSRGGTTSGSPGYSGSSHSPSYHVGGGYAGGRTAGGSSSTGSGSGGHSSGGSNGGGGTAGPHR
jgi:uncharacterized membrane protein YgcG